MSRRFAMNFTTVNSEMGNMDKRPATDRYERSIPNENILINHGTDIPTSTKHYASAHTQPEQSRTSKRNIYAPTSKHSQRLVVGPGSMRQFLAAGGVGGGCSSCGGAR